MHCHKLTRKALLCVAIFLIPLSAHADATVSTIQPLDFGKWVVAGNYSPGYVTVQTNGSYNSSSNMIMLEAPEYGIFRVSGLPSSSTIASINVTPGSPVSNGGGEEFVMDNFLISASAPSTDINGEATVRLGMTLRTSGNSQTYADGTFSGSVQIEFNF